MRITLLITLVLVYYCGSSQGFSKTGTEDLYLYKGTVLYWIADGDIIADVQKSFDEISILEKYGELFLRVVRKKESVKSLPDLSGMQTKTVETITRHVCRLTPMPMVRLKTAQSMAGHCMEPVLPISLTWTKAFGQEMYFISTSMVL